MKGTDGRRRGLREEHGAALAFLTAGLRSKGTGTGEGRRGGAGSREGGVQLGAKLLPGQGRSPKVWEGSQTPSLHRVPEGSDCFLLTLTRGRDLGLRRGRPR